MTTAETAKGFSSARTSVAAANWMRFLPARQSDARTRRTPNFEGLREAALRAKFIERSISFGESFQNAMRPRVAFHCYRCAFLQLLPDLVFLVPNVLQVTLEKRQLRRLRIRRVAKSLVVLTSEVRWSRFLRLTDPEK